MLHTIMLVFFVTMPHLPLNLKTRGQRDGERVTQCLKVLMLHFKCSGRINYSWKILRMQFQLAYLLLSLSHQLKWERFMNTHGGLGRNIQCNLFNEHMNKLFKQRMGPNMTKNAITRVACSVTTLSHITERFDHKTHVPVVTIAHATRSDEDNVTKVACVLLKNKIMTIIPGKTTQ